MPELPEVETVRRGLAPYLLGRRLARVEARRPDLRFPLPERFAERLLGARVERLDRRAKYLRAGLDTGETLIVHLGMSGRLSAADARAPALGLETDPMGQFYYAAPPDPAHTHVVFETDLGARIEYNDPRRFGFMLLAPSARLEDHAAFRGLGPEPLDPAFGADRLAAVFAGRRQSLKALLLDQRTVAGLGNIYVCEALHRAGLAPDRPAGAAPRAALARLAREIRAVLEEAIEKGGSSLRDYADPTGAKGAFQDGFRVYDRAGAPCPRPRCRGEIARFVQNGRSTFHCPRCQR